MVNSDIILTNSRGTSTKPLSEFTVGSILHFTRNFNYFEACKKKGYAPKRTQLPLLSGKIILIVGYGNIGKECARILKTAFSCKILAIKREIKEEIELPFVDEVGTMEYNFINYIQKADVVVNVLPYTKET